MKAILRWGTALLSLLLLTSASHAQYQLVSPVFKTPFPSVPSPSNMTGFYLMDAYGRWSGPHYYLVPPHPPTRGVLPGPIGQAIMSGNLPHELLMNKQAMAATLEGMPMLGKHGEQQGAPPQQQQEQQGGMGPYPTLGTAAMQQYGTMQMPHQAMATGQYAMPMPYAAAIPYQGMQAPMGYGPKPMMWAPYPGQAQPAPMPMPYPMPMQGQSNLQATYWKGSNGIWQVQNAPLPQGGPAPFTTIPGFQPGVLGTMPPMPGQHPGLGMMPTIPGTHPGLGTMPPMPPGPGMLPPPPNVGGGAPGFGPMQQFNPMQPFPPMQRFDPMSPLQGPQPRFDQMQLPRMDPMPPQAPAPGGSAYPVHPFTRSPRDFFMWGDVMEQERARANRPFPVP
jgi:hypothetical protein